jgi:hypothetical protein
MKRIARFDRGLVLLRRSLFALAACIGLSPLGTQASSAEASPIDRVAEIRERLLQMDEDRGRDVADAGASGRGERLAQWFNWPNLWANWPNWNNWGNWGNWGNWRNW